MKSNAIPCRTRVMVVVCSMVVGCGEGIGLDVDGVAGSRAMQGVTGAAFTTTNPDVDGPGHCRNGNEAVNCNLYDGKAYVWLSGGPLSAALGDGRYFFAVLQPGSQQNPNDGAAGNLSDVAPTTNTGAGDEWTHRVFTLLDGVIDYDGPLATHDFDSNKIRLMPYDDTPNPGGEYILAICRLGDVGDLSGGYPATPDQCKYDAFKVKPRGRPDDLEVTVSGLLTYDDTFSWSIAKGVDRSIVKQSDTSATLNYVVTVAHDAGTTSNWVLRGTALVDNPTRADVELQSIAVAVTPAVGDGTWSCDSLSPMTIPARSSASVSYECHYDPATGGPLGGSVTATVTWLVDGEPRTVTDTTNLDVAAATASAIDECVTVTDTFAGALGKVCVGDANPTAFTYTRAVTGVRGTCTTFDNTATFTTLDTGSTGSASQNATLCIGADLVVTKDALPQFIRRYEWSVAKDVDPERAKKVGGTATLTYVVDVNQTAIVDSNWVITGQIAVKNPNDWQDVEATVVDSATAGACIVYTPMPVTIPAGSTAMFDYACGFESGAAGTNTATAMWDAARAYTPSATASGTADYAFTTPTYRFFPTVTVVDSFAGVLGVVSATDARPFARATYVYTRDVPVPKWGCMLVDNTATLTETGQQASAQAEVCGPIRTGARTIGFWRNTNGQGLITGGASLGGVCRSGTWLRQFAPFQDLSSTATCAQVAAYVTTIINAANASGPAMNAMLKAQMLATALDVFFSDPALGGNRLCAPAPIGSVSIDLTLVCTDMSCATFQDSSSAFGGSPRTVLEMLTQAAGQSNAGGSLWYGNVKATQELAKDAFDAINNQKVFAP